MGVSCWSSDVCSSELGDDPQYVHIVMRAGADIVGVRHAILHEPHRRGLEFAIGLFEPAREIGECLIALGAAAFLVDDREKGLNGAPAILRELAADEDRKSTRLNSSH